MRWPLNVSSEILDYLNDTVVIFDSQGTILFSNRFVENYGFERDRLVGTKIWDYISPEFRDKVLEDMKKIERGESVERELKVLTPAGEVWVEYRSNPIKIGENTKVVFSTLRDITEKKKEEGEFKRYYEFTSKISSKLNMDEIFKLSYEELKNFVDFDIFTIGLVDRERNSVRIEFSVERGRFLPKRSYKILPEESLSSWVVYHGKPLLIRNFKEEEDNLPAKVHVVGGEPQSWLGVPLFLKDQIIGLLTVQSFEPYAYDERELRILQSLSSQLSMAIGNALLYQKIKEREENAHLERERYRNILENLLTGIVIIYEGKIIYVNRFIEEILGSRVQNLIGEDFIKFIHPEMKDLVLENYRRRMMGLPAPKNYVVKLIDDKGGIRWAQINATPVNWEGLQAELISLQDITHLKDMERKLMELVKVFRDIKIAKSKEEIYNMALNALFNVLNFSYVVVGEIKDNTIEITNYIGYDEYNIYPLNLYEDKGVIAWVARNKRPYYVPDVKKEPLYLPGGKDIRCEYATPIIIGDRLFGVLNIEKKEVNSIAEEERNLVDMLAEHMAVALASLERQEDLQRAKNFQELMVHIMSHDLKNPLAVSTGYVEMLREEYNPEYVEGANRALEEAFNIIEKVKLFSRLGSGKIYEKKTPLSLRSLIEKASSLILEKYAGTEVVLDMEEMRIEGYPLLDTVFLNIIDNAFKYGATKVTIKGTEFQDYVKISVMDNGPGIPEDMKDKIFEPFERLSSKRGSGLGLAIVKMIVQLHGGEVWVENNVPEGSIFIVQLPKG